MKSDKKMIFFFKEEIKFRLNKQDEIRRWIFRMIKKEGCILSNVNYIFCSDLYLRKINKSYLQHDYFTDIITFDNSVEKKSIAGDVYISIERIQENATTFKSTFNDELHRVMAHGVLHLLGYGDKNEKQRAQMKKQEDLWLKNRNF